MQRGLLILFAVVATFMFEVADAQIRIVSRERLDSLVSPKLAEGANLLFDEKRLQTGEIDESAEGLQYTYRFVNQSKEDIVITSVKSSCSCAVPHFESRIVAVCERDSIIVRYYPRGHVGRFERRLFVYTQLSDVRPSAVLSLVATVSSQTPRAESYPVQMGALRLKYATIRFDRTKSAVERIEVLNCSDRAMQITCQQEFLPRGIEFRCEPESIAAGECGDLVVRYDATEYGGRERVMLLLNGTGASPMQSALNIVVED